MRAAWRIVWASFFAAGSAAVGHSQEIQSNDAAVHANLIRQCFRESTRDPGAEKARVEQIVWMIAHWPEASVLSEPSATASRRGADYDAVESAWVERIQKPRRDGASVGQRRELLP
jgi:hypothetical protein